MTRTLDAERSDLDLITARLERLLDPRDYERLFMNIFIALDQRAREPLNLVGVKPRRVSSARERVRLHS